MAKNERGVAFEVDDIFNQAADLRRGWRVDRDRLSEDVHGLEIASGVKIEGPLLTKEELDKIVEKMKERNV